MKVLPYCLVYDDASNCGCAYLNAMIMSGCLPKYIIKITTKQRIRKLRFLPDYLNELITRLVLKGLNMRARYNQRHLIRSFLGTELHENYLVKRNLKKNCIQYLSAVVDSINDENLVRMIENVDVEGIIYTSGGIVRDKRLLEKGVFHIHPGIVPEVRGSDGLLWSVLERGKIGESCFFMGKEIDNGSLIFQKEYPIIKVSQDIKSIDPKVVYSFLMNYYDPYFRGMFLKEVLLMTDGLTNIELKEQDETKSKTYYVMHPILRRKAFEYIFNSKKAD